VTGTGTYQATIDTNFYFEHGYCQIRPVGQRFLEDVGRAAQIFDQIIREPVHDSSVQSYSNKAGRFRHLRYIHYQTDAFRRLMQSEEIDAIAGRVFRSQRMYVTHSKVSHKEVGQDLAWYPHQDNAYKLLHKLPRRDGMTIAIFLEDADDRNGTIQVFPGSHKLQTLPHRLQQGEHSGGSGQLIIEALPDIKPESVIAKKGDILIFTLDTIHQSLPNQSRGYRPVFLFEIKPYEGFPLDELGRPPIVMNGGLSPVERLIYLFAPTIRRIGLLKKTSRPPEGD
jgi:ectoine hydroxylase-related dioxygenase (phytanoyl-CoA dioxygenase family)